MCLAHRWGTSCFVKASLGHAHLNTWSVTGLRVVLLTSWSAPAVPKALASSEISRGCVMTDSLARAPQMLVQLVWALKAFQRQHKSPQGTQGSGGKGITRTECPITYSHPSTVFAFSSPPSPLSILPFSSASSGSGALRYCHATSGIRDTPRVWVGSSSLLVRVRISF